MLKAAGTYTKTLFQMAFYLETSRLLLRELTPDDAPGFFQLNEDPLVIQYTGDRPFQDIDEARAFLENYDQYALYGYGRWAVTSRENGDFLGWCGLKYMPDLQETDLGYRFLRKHWGQGFATEAAKACLDYGLTILDLPQIVGRAWKANVPSIRVLEKIGMEYWKDAEFEGQAGVYYRKRL